MVTFGILLVVAATVAEALVILKPKENNNQQKEINKLTNQEECFGAPLSV